MQSKLEHRVAECLDQMREGVSNVQGKEGICHNDIIGNDRLSDLLIFFLSMPIHVLSLKQIAIQKESVIAQSYVLRLQTCSCSLQRLPKKSISGIFFAPNSYMC